MREEKKREEGRREEKKRREEEKKSEEERREFYDNLLLSLIGLQIFSTLFSFNYCAICQIIFFQFIYLFIFFLSIQFFAKSRWCRDNDEKCQVISKNAQELYRTYVSKEGILDYMQVTEDSVETLGQGSDRWIDRCIGLGRE